MMSKGKSQAIPPGLHVILAREKNVGVIFRRRPGRNYATYGWNCDQDRVKIGQWMKNRIYPRRADISPDGRHLIYFAMNGAKGWDDGSIGSWTAVSKVPYLKALDFYPKGDCWEGGGLFLSNVSYLLNDRYFSEKTSAFQNSGLAREKTEPVNREFGAEDRAVYYTRLIRDGWSATSLFEGEAQKMTSRFEKPVGKGWNLRKIDRWQFNVPERESSNWEEYELFHLSGKTLRYEAWEWADVNSRSLVWTEDGCLYRAPISQKEGVGSRKLIYDFSVDSFQNIEAPY